jgi:hypothetical protein
MAAHCHLVVDLTVTSARTNTDVLEIDTCLLLPGSPAVGAQNSKLVAGLRTPALLGTPSVHQKYIVGSCMKLKLHYNNIGKMVRLLSNGHKYSAIQDT